MFQRWLSLHYQLKHHTLEVITFALQVLATCLLTACCVSFASSARPIRRGKSWATILAMIHLFPFAAILIFLSALFAGYPLTRFFIGVNSRFITWELLLFLPAILLAFLAVVCIDLFRYLAWIQKSPRSDIPSLKLIR